MAPPAFDYPNPDTCPVLWRGNNSIPANTVITSSGNSSAIVVADGAYVCFQDLTISNSGSAGTGLQLGGSTISLAGNLYFTGAGRSGLWSGNNSVFENYSAINFQGTFASAIEASVGSNLNFTAGINLTGNTTTTQFALADSKGLIKFNNATINLNGHANTGLKFTSSNGSTILTGVPGGDTGFTYLPGTSFAIGFGSTYDDLGWSTIGPFVNYTGSASVPVALAGTAARFRNANANQTYVVGEASGAGAAVSFIGRTSAGTAAVPAAVQSGVSYLCWAGYGYGTTGFNISNSNAGICVTAAQTYTDANQGTQLDFYVTPNNSTTETKSASLFNNGVFNALLGFQVAGAATSGNVLRGNGTNFVNAQLACADLSTPCITGNQTITLSGDVTGSGTTAITTTLATVNANTGSFGTATQVAQVTYNGKGLATAVANVTITPAISNVTGLGTGVATALGVNIGTSGAFMTDSSTNTMTNKTFDTAGAGNVFKINGTTINGTTGTGTTVVLSSSPVIASPTITTLAVDPLLIGGVVAGSSLELRSTSVTGSGDLVKITGGTNGGTTLATFLGSAGTIGFGTTAGAAAPSNTVVAISANTASQSGAQAGTTTYLHVVSADGVIGSMEFDTFANGGATFPFIGMRSANGTAASKTATTASIIGDIAGLGWTGSAYTDASDIIFNAAETFSGSSQGTFIDIKTTASTTTTRHTFRFFGSGGLAIDNTTDPGAGGLRATGATIQFTALANAATTSALCYNTGTGLITYDGTIGTCTVSDERLKNIGPRIAGALDKLLQIDGVYYTWRDPAMGTGRQIGLSAQTVERVFPELVQTDSEGRKSLDYQRLTAPIIEAIRELKADNDDMKAKLVQLRKAAN